MINFLHNYFPSSILLEVGFLKIYWYGLFLTAAIFICFLIMNKLAGRPAYLALRSARNALRPARNALRSIAGESIAGESIAGRPGLDKNKIFNLSFYLVIWGIIGARIWHVVFYNFPYFLSQPLEIFKIWHGGLAIHGALASGILVVYYYSKKYRLKFWQLADLMAVVLPLAQAIGRWGNYFNQELFGWPCSFSWCIPVSEINRPEQFVDFQYFHPVFLYESILCFLLFILCFLLFQSKKVSTGTVALTYLFSYSAIRFFMEFLRMDVLSYLFLGLKWTQWLCLAVIAVSLFFLAKKRGFSAGLAKK